MDLTTVHESFIMNLLPYSTVQREISNTVKYVDNYFIPSLRHVDVRVVVP